MHQEPHAPIASPRENAMAKISHLLVSISRLLPVMMFLLAATDAEAADNASEPKLKVDNHSFKCITEMTPVRHFYVDNLLGNLEGTVVVAKAGRGEYPGGSVVQLIPNEVMITHEKGFTPATRDWEFFYIDVDGHGSKIFRRGFAEVNNRFGQNCFACHAQARVEFDLICEQDHGCAPIPVTPAPIGAPPKRDAR